MYEGFLFFLRSERIRLICSNGIGSRSSRRWLKNPRPYFSALGPFEVLRGHIDCTNRHWLHQWHAQGCCLHQGYWLCPFHSSSRALCERITPVRLAKEIVWSGRVLTILERKIQTLAICMLLFTFPTSMAKGLPVELCVPRVRKNSHSHFIAGEPNGNALFPQALSRVSLLQRGGWQRQVFLIGLNVDNYREANL